MGFASLSYRFTESIGDAFFHGDTGFVMGYGLPKNSIFLINIHT
jgi:hypothetical protein